MGNTRRLYQAQEFEEGRIVSALKNSETYRCINDFVYERFVMRWVLVKVAVSGKCNLILHERCGDRKVCIRVWINLLQNKLNSRSDINWIRCEAGSVNVRKR